LREDVKKNLKLVMFLYLIFADMFGFPL